MSSGGSRSASSDTDSTVSTTAIRDWSPKGEGNLPLLRPGKFDSVFVCGPSGSGKTCMLSAWLRLVRATPPRKGGFDLVFAYSNNRNTLGVYERLIPLQRGADGKPRNLVHWESAGPAHIDSIIAAQARRSAEGLPALRVLLILDDVLSTSLRFREEAATLTQLYTNGRHSGVAVWLLSQTYANSVPTAVTKNTQLSVFFRVRDARDKDAIVNGQVRGAVSVEDIGTTRTSAGSLPTTELGLARTAYSEATRARGALIVDFRDDGGRAHLTLFRHRVSARDVKKYDRAFARPVRAFGDSEEPTDSESD